MRIIITGAGGLLAHRLAAEARLAGHKIIGIDRTLRPPAELACDRWITGDLADARMRACDWEVFAGAAVFHLAADTRVHEAGRDFVRDNVATTETACVIAHRTGGRLVFFSSSAVYSGPKTQRPVTALAESDETNPTSSYGRSKLAAEEVIQRAGIEAVVLRLFGVLSDRLPLVPDRGNLIQAIFRACALDGKVAVSLGRDGQPAVRDYVLDEDIARCALDALAWPRAADGPTTVNVCTGEGTSALEIVELAQALTDRPVRVQMDRSHSGANPVMVGDPSELRKRHKSIPANRVREFLEQLLSNRAPAR